VKRTVLLAAQIRMFYAIAFIAVIGVSTVSAQSGDSAVWTAVSDSKTNKRAIFFMRLCESSCYRQAAQMGINF